MDNIPTNTTLSEFSVYRHSKINALSNHKENNDTFIDDW